MSVELIAQITRQSIEIFNSASWRVKRIAEQRGADGCQVNADLMWTTRMNRNLKQMTVGLGPQ